jgi:hypothetical protein
MHEAHINARWFFRMEKEAIEKENFKVVCRSLFHLESFW